MANYFTNFSFILTLPNEAAQAYALELLTKVEQLRDEENPTGFPNCLREAVEDWSFETLADGNTNLWFHSICGGVDAACAFIQHLLTKFDPKGCVGFEWANDCSKPQVDVFGGGAVIVTARNIKTINTGEWLHKQMAKHPQPQT